MVVLNLLNLYLVWSEANHAKSTHKRVRASIKSFGVLVAAGVADQQALALPPDPVAQRTVSQAAQR